MGYKNEAAYAEFGPFRDQVRRSLLDRANDIIQAQSSGNAFEMAIRIITEPDRILAELSWHLAHTRGLTAESADAEIDTAMEHAETTRWLKARLGFPVA